MRLWLPMQAGHHKYHLQNICLRCHPPQYTKISLSLSFIHFPINHPPRHCRKSEKSDISFALFFFDGERLSEFDTISCTTKPVQFLRLFTTINMKFMTFSMIKFFSPLLFVLPPMQHRGVWSDFLTNDV